MLIMVSFDGDAGIDVLRGILGSDHRLGLLPMPLVVPIGLTLALPQRISSEPDPLLVIRVNHYGLPIWLLVLNRQRPSDTWVAIRTVSSPASGRERRSVRTPEQTRRV